MKVSSVILKRIGFLLLMVLASSQAPGQAVLFERGDANADGTIDPRDAVYLLSWLYGAGPCPLSACGVGAGGAQKQSVGNGQPNPAVTIMGSMAPAKQAASVIPPLPVGVSELKFSDFFVHPVGDRGLKPTEKLLELHGNHVRILGYMVWQESSPPGGFLLTPIPAQVHEHDNGLADDLPASMVHVSVPTRRDQPVPYAPGLMLLTGRLSVGNRTETDGRISVVRLALDPPEPSGKEEPMLKSRPGTNGKGAPVDSSK